MAKQPFKVTKSVPQKTTGSSATKKSATKKANSGSSSASYAGLTTTRPIFSAGSGNVSGQPASANVPRFTLPNGTPTVTPVAPPKIDPFLTPTDEANESIENGQWDDYIANLVQQRETNDTDVKLKVGDIDQSLSEGLAATDWNTAARGIQNSSIKSQAKAKMTADAAASKGAELDKQSTFHNYVGNQQKQVDTVYKPAIGKKYNQLRVDNATRARDGWNLAHPDSPLGPDGQPNPYYRAPQADPAADVGGGAAPAASGGPTYNYDPGGGAIPSISAAGSASQGSSPEGKVKNGKFYHVYNYGTASERWVYVRPAS